MTVPRVPNRLVDGGNLDVDKVNEDIEAIAADAQRSIDRRYTYSRALFDLSGMADTDDKHVRQIPLVIPSGMHPSKATVVAVELVVVATDTNVWSASLSGPTTAWPGFSVTSPGSATAEASGGDSTPFVIDSTLTNAIQLACSGGSTLLAGSYAIVHFRGDRMADDAATAAGAVLTPIEADTSTAASTINDALTTLAALVASDAADDGDLRVECFVARNLASGSTVSWQFPSGQRRRAAMAGFVVLASGAGKQITFTVDGTTLVVPGTGATSLAGSDQTLSGSESDAPTTPGSDGTASIACAGGTTALMAVLWVFWS